MARYCCPVVALFLVFTAINSSAQVTVTNSGFATMPGPAYPAIPVSPPILFTPTVQLGVAPTQPIQVMAVTSSVPVQVEPQFLPEMVVQVPAPQPSEVRPNTAVVQPAQNGFNFGAAQFDTHYGSGGVGQDINGKSLGEIAREQRQRPASANARVYTNSNIDQLNQTGGTVNTPSGRGNPAADNWSPNNGVISPERQQAPQNAVGTPGQQNPPPASIRAPFVPKPQSHHHDRGGSAALGQPQPGSRSALRPLVRREGDGIAPDVLLAWREPGTDPEQGASENQLPGASSRLPLIGVAGLVSISMGLFVRYQRAKAR
jgi:hypothetical protein